MRKIPWLPLLTAVCASTSLHADLTVVQQVDGIAQMSLTAMMIKAGHARFDASPEMSVITDLKSGETIRLMHSDKSYMRIPGPGQLTHVFLGAEWLRSPGMPKNGRTASMPTGRKGTVSGYSADEYTGASADIKTSAWLTKAVPDYANLLKEMQASRAEGLDDAMSSGIFALDAAALPGFPVRAVYAWGPGEIVTSTVLSISAKPIPDSEFEIPAGYEQRLD